MQRHLIFVIGIGSRVSVLVESADRVICTSVARTWRAVSSCAAEQDKIRAVRQTYPTISALPVNGTFSGKFHSMNKSAVMFDFFAYCRFVLAKNKSDSSFSRTISNTVFDNGAFSARKVLIRIR